MFIYDLQSIYNHERSLIYALNCIVLPSYDGIESLYLWHLYIFVFGFFTFLSSSFVANEFCGGELFHSIGMMHHHFDTLLRICRRFFNWGNGFRRICSYSWAPLENEVDTCLCRSICNWKRNEMFPLGIGLESQCCLSNWQSELIFWGRHFYA